MSCNRKKFQNFSRWCHYQNAGHPQDKYLLYLQELHSTMKISYLHMQTKTFFTCETISQLEKTIHPSFHSQLITNYSLTPKCHWIFSLKTGNIMVKMWHDVLHSTGIIFIFIDHLSEYLEKCIQWIISTKIKTMLCDISCIQILLIYLQCLLVQSLLLNICVEYAVWHHLSRALGTLCVPQPVYLKEIYIQISDSATLSCLEE